MKGTFFRAADVARFLKLAVGLALVLLCFLSLRAR
jgi:hypothetical protein